MINIGGSCNCSSPGALGRLGAVSASEACNQPGAWVTAKGSDGKCYSVCVFTGERYEIDAAGCDTAIAIPAGWQPGQPLASSSLIPGVSNTTLMIGGGALLLVLLMVMIRR